VTLQSVRRAERGIGEGSLTTSTAAKWSFVLWIWIRVAILHQSQGLLRHQHVAYSRADTHYLQCNASNQSSLTAQCQGHRRRSKSESIWKPARTQSLVLQPRSNHVALPWQRKREHLKANEDSKPGQDDGGWREKRLHQMLEDYNFSGFIPTNKQTSNLVTQDRCDYFQFLSPAKDNGK